MKNLIFNIYEAPKDSFVNVCVLVVILSRCRSICTHACDVGRRGRDFIIMSILVCVRGYADEASLSYLILNII